MAKPGRGGAHTPQEGDGPGGALHSVGSSGVGTTQHSLLTPVLFGVVLQEPLYPRAVLLKLERVSESSGGFAKTQVVGPHAQRLGFSGSGAGPRICISEKQAPW